MQGVEITATNFGGARPMTSTARSKTIAWLCVCGAIAALRAPQRAHADGDDADREARNVAAAVQAFYDQTKDVSAGFFQTYVNKLYKRTDRSSGQVVFKKPGMMRWDYAMPNGKVIVSNGKRMLAYEPGEDGDKGQVLEQQISE